MNFSMGFFPDLLSGKSFGDSLKDSVTQGAVISAGMLAPGLVAPEAAIASGPFAGAMPSELVAANGGASAGGMGGLLGGMKSAAGYIKPISEAAGAANSVKGLLGGSPQNVQSHAPQMNPGGGQSLTQLYQQSAQPSAADQARMQAMLQRKTMWG